jgi:hypothetical protein
MEVEEWLIGIVLGRELHDRSARGRGGGKETWRRLRRESLRSAPKDRKGKEQDLVVTFPCWQIIV